MSIKSRISQFAARLTIKARAWMLHRQIEALYRRANRVKQHQRNEREAMANQHQLELANLEKRTRQLECAKIQLHVGKGGYRVISGEPAEFIGCEVKP